MAVATLKAKYANEASQFVELSPWIPRFNINYHLGVDGISMPFIILNSFITVIVVLAGWQVIQYKPAQYNAAFLIMSGLINGAFAAQDGGDTSGFGGLVAPIVMPGPTERPYGEWFDAAADEIELALADRGVPMTSAVEKVVVDRGEITFFVRREHLLPFASVLRDEPALRFEMCMGVNGVHYPGDAGRELHAVYPFQSVTHNRRIRVEVEDDGAGVASGEVQRLFTPFDRLGQQNRAKVDGTGLGLALSKRLIESMGGQIGYEAPDRGARFWFTLPGKPKPQPVKPNP